MRIIKKPTLDAYAEKYPDARLALQRWHQIARHASWPHFAATRRDFPHADQVTVKSGGPVTIFNIKGNAYRLITAIHYNRSTLYILRFFTHADYDRTDWKHHL